MLAGLSPLLTPGQVLRCNFAQPQKSRGGESGWSAQPVWADADAYQEALVEEEEAK